MGSDGGFLTLVTTPEVKRFSDLKGKTLSVDARTTGYAFVLFEMLARNGLDESDYSVEKVGGTAQRWNALHEKKQSGTLLSAPFNLVAREQHFTELAKATNVIGPYQGNVGATRHSWAQRNEKLVIGFIRGYIQAIDWLYDQKNREEAMRILEKNVPELPPSLAQQSYEELLDPQSGFSRKARINFDGLQTVLELRSRYAEPKKKLSDPLKYYDASYYDAATRGGEPINGQDQIVFTSPSLPPQFRSCIPPVRALSLQPRFRRAGYPQKNICYRLRERWPTCSGFRFTTQNGYGGEGGILTLTFLLRPRVFSQITQTRIDTADFDESNCLNCFCWFNCLAQISASNRHQRHQRQAQTQIRSQTPRSVCLSCASVHGATRLLERQGFIGLITSWPLGSLPNRATPSHFSCESQSTASRDFGAKELSPKGKMPQTIGAWRLNQPLAGLHTSRGNDRGIFPQANKKFIKSDLTE